jgi:hypothetical protein
MGMQSWLASHLNNYLNRELPSTRPPLCDFEKLRFEIRQADVLLVEGRTQVSEVIKVITQSPWTHSALYVGRLSEIDEPELRELVQRHYSGAPESQLLIEALIGRGTVVTPLEQYRGEHMRICRPSGLSRMDAQTVIERVASRLGDAYDLRQLLDLARFLFPWGVLPRRWRSSLFEHNVGEPTRTVCSTLLVDAFTEVNFPVLPVVRSDADGRLRLYPRNSRLFTPRDFDYSPYFDIIKYPFVAFEDCELYRRLPWEHGTVCNDEDDAPVALPVRPLSDLGL